MPIRKIVLLIITVFIYTVTSSQSRVDSLLAKLDPQKFAASFFKKSKQLEEKLLEKSLTTLGKLQKQEEKVYRRLLHTKDSALAKNKLAEIKSRYVAMREQVKIPSLSSVANKYIPGLDSFSTTLKFLEANGMGTALKDAIAKTNSLQGKFAVAEEVKKFIKERKEQLKLQLEKLGFARNLKQLNKRVYYYARQVSEYKEMLNNPKKMERKVLDLLSKTKAWKDFFRKHSELASLFPMPGGNSINTASQSGFAGLQTRTQLSQFFIQSGLSGPNSSDQLQQSIQNIQSQIAELKNKASDLFGGNNVDNDLPDFKPNNQKTKSFFKRLEYGTNIQSQKAYNLLPVTTDLAISVGYKLNDNSIGGIGVSYKIGWGKGWDNIKLTNEGVGLRSFIDWKIKNSWWISGGFEQNYRRTFVRMEELKDFNAWQKSGLIGVSKIISLKSKFLKSTKIQILFDFLSTRQVPRTQPILLRVGYSFN